MAKCYLHDIINPDPDALDKRHWDDLYSRMQESGWYGIQGKRMGFVNMTRESSMIGGYFASEGRKKGIQYDEQKEQLEPQPFHSFEHLFFVLFEDTSQLLLQSRNIYGYTDLTLPRMRHNLFLLLADLFRLAGVYVAGECITLDTAGMTYSQEQLYHTFVSIAEVTELEISGLYAGIIPAPDDPRYKLFNPRDEWNEITWGAVADTLKSGLDHIEMSTAESTDTTLQAPIPKALAAAGSIEKIRGRDQQGRVVFRQRKEDAELEIELPVLPGAVLGLMDRILENLDSRGRAETWQERRLRRDAAPRNGHLF